MIKMGVKHEIWIKKINIKNKRLRMRKTTQDEIMGDSGVEGGVSLSI